MPPLKLYDLTMTCKRSLGSIDFYAKYLERKSIHEAPKGLSEIPLVIRLLRTRSNNDLSFLHISIV